MTTRLLQCRLIAPNVLEALAIPPDGLEDAMKEALLKRIPHMSQNRHYPASVSCLRHDHQVSRSSPGTTARPISLKDCHWSQTRSL